MTCKSCTYWWPFEAKRLVKRVEVDRAGATKGECRKNAIVVTALQGDVFPTSKAEQWCGEFKKFEDS